MNQKENVAGTVKFGARTSKTIRRNNLKSVKNGKASNANRHSATLKSKAVAIIQD